MVAALSKINHYAQYCIDDVMIRYNRLCNAKIN